MISAFLSLTKNFLKSIVMKNAMLYKFYIRLRFFLNPDRRCSLAKRYLKGGAGIEIGALHRPLVVPSQAQVKYVDRLPTSELRLQYPELKECPLVDVEERH